MKNVKITNGTHKILKLYSVKNGKDMSEVADRAILNEVRQKVYAKSPTNNTKK